MEDGTCSQMVLVTPSLRRRLRTTWTDVLINRVGGGQGQDDDVKVTCTLEVEGGDLLNLFRFMCNHLSDLSPLQHSEINIFFKCSDYGC